MKKMLLNAAMVLFLLAGSISCLFAQNAEGIIYQAEARDNQGAILANQSLIVKINILRDSYNGFSVWEEQHHITTNTYGAFVLVIGSGERTTRDEKTNEIITGRFDEISWSAGTHYLNVQVKKTESAEWIDMGTSQFLSVPYAMHAKTAESLTGEGSVKANGPGVPSQNWSLFGNSKTNADVDKLGTTDYNGLVLVTDNLDRFHIGADGNIALAKSLDIGENLTVKQSAYLNTISGETVNNGPFTVAAQSPSLLTGTLTVNDATHLMSTLDVTGATNLANTLDVIGATELMNTLDVTGATALMNTLDVTGATTLMNTLDVTNATDLHSTLHVMELTHLEDQLSVTGAAHLDNTLSVSGTAQFNGQVTVKPSAIGGDQGSYGSYPLRVEGSSNGIAIKVNAGTPNSGNNFVTFFDAGGSAKGRIEGQNATELLTDPEFIFQSAIYYAEIIAAGVNIGLSALPNACAGVGAVACPPEPSVVAIAIADEILAIANLAAYQVFAAANLGVTYESGSADYAEWLERLNYAERIMPGDIVGLKGDKVTKNTFGVNHFLVASTNPAVLGNMPDSGKEDAFEMIAFMGQVPVKVRGTVNIGDYILPSGLNDGTGIPVSPETITAEQYESIVGIAWSATPVTAGISIINMAIGLNTNDLAKQVTKQAAQIKSLESTLASLEKRISSIESGNIQKGMPQKKDVAAVKAETPQAEYYTINAAEVEHAIMLLQDAYQNMGISPEAHAGLNKLFTDAQYRMQIIEQVIATYEKNIGITK